MRIIPFIVGLVVAPDLLKAAEALSSAQQAKITTQSVATINKARGLVTEPAASMRQVYPSIDCQEALYGLVVRDGAAYTFENRFALTEGVTACDGYEFMLEDSTIGPNGVNGIVDFRVRRQKGCFAFDNCSKTTWNGYESCYNTLAKVKVGCNYFTDYPKLMSDVLSQVAIVYLPFRPVISGPQKSTFLVFGKSLNRDGTVDDSTPQNDVPWVPGVSASKCPPGTVPAKNLCALTNKPN